MNTSGPLAFQTTFNRPLHQIFASWPGQDSSHGRNQLNAAHTTWGNQHSASVYPAPQLSIPYPHQQHQHQHMPWSNDQHMLQSAAMTPDISVQHQPQQPRDYQGWARDPNALSSKASDASGYCRQQQFPGGGIPHVTGHPQQQMPTLGAAQSTIPQRSEPAKRLRLSPVQEYPGGTRILARPANAWPGLPQQTEGILHTGKACYQPAPHALQPAHSGAKRPSPNWTASDAHSRTLPASNVHQHQQHVHASDFQSTHLAQAAAARHQSAIRRTSGAHTGGNPAPMNGVRPGLLAELASDLGVSSPSSPVLPKCRAFVPHRPKTQLVPARKQAFHQPGRVHSRPASDQQQARLHGATDHASWNAGGETRSAGIQTLKITPPSEGLETSEPEHQAGWDDQQQLQQQRQDHMIADAPPNVAPGMFVTAGSRRPVIPASAAHEDQTLLLGTSTSDRFSNLAGSCQSAKGSMPQQEPLKGSPLPEGLASWKCRHALADAAVLQATPQVTPGGSALTPDRLGPHLMTMRQVASNEIPANAPGTFMTAGKGVLPHQDTGGLGAADQAPRSAPGHFTRAAASGSAPDVAPGQFVTAGTKQYLGQPEGCQKAGGTRGKFRRGQQRIKRRSSTNRTDFLTSFAAELADLGNPLLEDDPSSEHFHEFPAAEPLAANASPCDPIQNIQPNGLQYPQAPTAQQDVHRPPGSHHTASNANCELAALAGEHGPQQPGSGDPFQVSVNLERQAGNSERRMSLDQGVLAGLLDTQLSSQRWSAPGCQATQPPYPGSPTQPPENEPHAPARHHQLPWPQDDAVSTPPGIPEHGHAAAEAPQLRTARGTSVHLDPLRLQQARKLLETGPHEAGQPPLIEKSAPQAAMTHAALPEQGIHRPFEMGAARHHVSVTEAAAQTSPEPAARRLPGLAQLKTAGGHPIKIGEGQLQQARVLLGDDAVHHPAVSLQKLDTNHASHAAPEGAWTSDCGSPAAAPIQPFCMTTAAGRPIPLDPAKLQRARALLEGPSPSGPERHKSPPVSTPEFRSDLDPLRPALGADAGQQGGVSPPQGPSGEPVALDTARLKPAQTAPFPEETSLPQDRLPFAQAVSAHGPAWEAFAQTAAQQKGLSLLQTAAGLPITIDPAKLQQAYALFEGPNAPSAETSALSQQSPELPSSQKAAVAVHHLSLRPRPADGGGLSMLQTAGGRSITIDPAKLQRAQVLLGDADAPSADASASPPTLPGPPPSHKAAVAVQAPDLGRPATDHGGLSRLQTAAGRSIIIDPAKLQRAQALLGDADAHSADASACPPTPPGPPPSHKAAVAMQAPDLGRLAADQGGLPQLQTAAGRSITIDPVRLQRAEAMLGDAAASCADAVTSSNEPPGLPAFHNAAVSVPDSSPRQPAADQGIGLSLLRTAGGRSITIDPAKLQRAQALLGNAASSEGSPPDLCPHHDDDVHVSDSALRLCKPHVADTSIATDPNGAEQGDDSLRKLASNEDREAATALHNSRASLQDISNGFQWQGLPSYSAQCADQGPFAGHGSSTPAKDAQQARQKQHELCETPRGECHAFQMQTLASGELPGPRSLRQAGTEPGQRSKRSGRSRLAASVSGSAAEGPSGLKTSSFKVPRRNKFKTPMRKLAMTKVEPGSICMDCSQTPKLLSCAQVQEQKHL